MKRRNVAILGSTGSIGTQALDVIARHPDRFAVTGLAAGRNVALLAEQAKRFGARVVADASLGPDGLMNVATQSNADIVLAATDGAVAFEAVFAAVDRGIDIAIANKELIVAAGELLVAAARAGGARLIPVDSEHSAIFQCLTGEDPGRVRAIVLTASGGPFLRATREAIEAATLDQALAHPTWRMGTKNTIDSATMMNKGLEIIEAGRLFEQPAERLHVVVHPQSIAHGFVVFTDGSVKAQLAAPDMRVPIGYAMSYPDRLPSDPASAVRAGDFDALGALGGKSQEPWLRYDFEAPDGERFPCLNLAYRALAAGGTVPAALSAANEVAVDAFVEGKIGFGGIARLIEAVLGDVPRRDASLAAIREADRAARKAANAYVTASETPAR
ncbi:MAG: 1-deoxy-D-xylulose-5-phosphate reductoisomerase [Vulcanimicrobiaceae bacterium]